MTSTCYLDIYAGDKQKHEEEDRCYQATRSLLTKHAQTFGLPTLPEELSSEQLDILHDIHVHQFRVPSAGRLF